MNIPPPRWQSPTHIFPSPQQSSNDSSHSIKKPDSGKADFLKAPVRELWKKNLCFVLFLGPVFYLFFISTAQTANTWSNKEWEGESDEVMKMPLFLEGVSATHWTQTAKRGEKWFHMSGFSATMSSFLHSDQNCCRKTRRWPFIRRNNFFFLFPPQNHRTYLWLLLHTIIIWGMKRENKSRCITWLKLKLQTWNRHLFASLHQLCELLWGIVCTQTVDYWFS